MVASSLLQLRVCPVRRVALSLHLSFYLTASHWDSFLSVVIQSKSHTTLGHMIPISIQTKVFSSPHFSPFPLSLQSMCGLAVCAELVFPGSSTPCRL